ncbi:hypothetical protein ACFL1Y_01995 [Patescibacteria group bacterium]
MRSQHESKIGFVYGILLIIILAIVIIFLLCDFNILPINTCTKINKIVVEITKFVNDFLGIK